MGGLEFFGQLEHVIVFAADDPVAANLGRIGGREADGDRIVMHVQADEQNGAHGGHCRSLQRGGGVAGRRFGAWRAR